MGISEVAEITIRLDHVGECTLPLFKKYDKDGNYIGLGSSAIIYGRNGSGKSSIAGGLAAGAAQLRSDNGRNLSLEGVAEQIHVFNDAYVDKNFRQVGVEGLDPIVLLGDAALEQENRDEIEAQIREAEAGFDRKRQAVAKLESGIDKDCADIKKALRGSSAPDGSSWALRSARYSVDEQKRNVTDKVFQNVLGATSDASLSADRLPALAAQFDEALSKLKHARKSKKIEWSTPPPPPQVDLKELQRMLDAVAAPQVAGGDSTFGVLERIRDQSIPVTELRSRRDGLFAEESHSCPHCLQDLPREFKEVARRAIDEYISAVAENQAADALLGLKVRSYDECRLPQEEVGDGSAGLLLSKAVDELNAALEGVNERIQEKIDNPGAAITVLDSPVGAAVASFAQAVREFEEALRTHNDECDMAVKFQESCETLNTQIAALEVHGLIASLNGKRRALEPLVSERDELEAGLNEKRRRLDDLEAACRNEKPAADEINRLLSIVAGPDGLKVRPKGRGYRVVCRSKDVPPDKLSTGERNILALCYFLVSMARDGSFQERFLDDQMLVLDDPISSFDYDNKYGVVSLLNWLAWKCAERGTAKVVIFTHDPAVAYDLSKTFNRACKYHRDWELSEGSLVNSRFGDIDIYGRNLSAMYEFAFEGRSSTDLGLTPNDVRRVWEAFVTFELGESPTDAFDSKPVREYFATRPEAERAFLAAFPGRAFLHSDSHSEVQMKNYDYYLLPALDEGGFRRFTAGVLLLIDSVSSLHLTSRLSSKARKTEMVRATLDSARGHVVATGADAGGDEGGE